MRHRTTVVLFTLFLTGMGVLWWADYADVPTREQRQERLNRILPELIDTRTTEITRFEVDRSSGPRKDRIIVERHDGGWQLRVPVDAAADPELVETLARNLKDLRKSADSGTIKGDPSPYGLNEPEAVVKVFVEKKRRPVATLELGKASKERVYVRPGAGSGIEVVDPRLLSALNLPAIRWRDTALFRLPSFRVKGVTVRESAPGREIEIERDERRWRLLRPIKVPADNDKAEGLVAELTALHVSEGDTGFVADAVTDRAKYGLDTPSMTVTMTPFDNHGKPQTVLIGTPVAPGKPDEVYAMRADQTNVVRVDVKRLREAVPGPNGLRSQTVLDLTPARVDRVRVEAGETAYDLSKAPTGWKLSSPVGGPADNASVQTLLVRLSELKSSEFLDAALVTEPRLDPPAFRVRGWQPVPGGGPASAGGPKGEPSFDLSLGRHDVARKTVYGRVAGDKTILALPESILEELPKNAFAYRNRTLLSIEPPRFASVTVERDGSAVTVEAPPKVGPTGLRWKMVKPVEAPADESAVTTLLLALGNLRAESWEADAVGDGKAFGLDAPWLRVKWTLSGGTGSPKTSTAGEKQGVLRLGKVKPGGASFYANLEGDERVIALNPGVVAPLEAELHTRNVMGFKPDDAERLVLKWPARTISLEKRVRTAVASPGWEVSAGYDPAGFDVSRAADLVKALSELKTARFLQYSGPIPDASGLKTPRLVVEVRLAGRPGALTLRLGNDIGQSAIMATDAVGATGPEFALPLDAWKDHLKAPRRPDELPDDVFSPHAPSAPRPRG